MTQTKKILTTNTRIAGIDYSMTCPCVCIHTGATWSLDNCTFHFHTAKKKHIITQKNFHPYLSKDWLTTEERFDNLALWALKSMRHSIVRSESFEHHPKSCYPESIFMEGYAFASKGQVFSIGENGGVLKNYLYRLGFRDQQDFHLIEPGKLKKFASGKGNADKKILYEFFVEETKFDIVKLCGGKVGDSPWSDIVDAYYLAKFGFQTFGLAMDGCLDSPIGSDSN